MENIAVKLVSEFNKIVMVYERQFDELSLSGQNQTFAHKSGNA